MGELMVNFGERALGIFGGKNGGLVCLDLN